MTPPEVRTLIRAELYRFVDRLVPLLSPCSDAAEYHNRVQLLRGAVAPEVLSEEEAAVAVSAMSFKLRHHLKPLNSRTTSCELCGETWPMWQAGQAARDECPGTPEPDIDEPPEQWETVRGIELREGDTIRFSNGERLTLGPRSSMRESPSSLWREFVVSDGFFIVNNDSRFERLVRPEPKPVRQELTVGQLGWLCHATQVDFLPLSAREPLRGAGLIEASPHSPKRFVYTPAGQAIVDAAVRAANAEMGRRDV